MTKSKTNLSRPDSFHNSRKIWRWEWKFSVKIINSINQIDTLSSHILSVNLQSYSKRINRVQQENILWNKKNTKLQASDNCWIVGMTATESQWLTMSIFFLWEHVKDYVYSTNFDDLKHKITSVNRNIPIRRNSLLHCCCSCCKSLSYWLYTCTPVLFTENYSISFILFTFLVIIIGETIIIKYFLDFNYIWVYSFQFDRNMKIANHLLDRRKSINNVNCDEHVCFNKINVTQSLIMLK